MILVDERAVNALLLHCSRQWPLLWCVVHYFCWCATIPIWHASVFPATVNTCLFCSTYTNISVHQPAVRQRYMCVGLKLASRTMKYHWPSYDIRTLNALPQLLYRSLDDASCVCADIWIWLHCRRAHFCDPSGLQELRWWAKRNWSCKGHIDLYPAVKGPELPKLPHYPHWAWRIQCFYSGHYSTQSSGVSCSGNVGQNSENNPNWTEFEDFYRQEFPGTHF